MLDCRLGRHIITVAALAGLGAFAVAQRANRPDDPKADGPRLFVTTEQLDQAHAKAKLYPWAARAEREILRKADAFPRSYEEKFGLSSVELPSEGGQWGHFYACPDTGTGLVFHPPNQHICPDTGKVYRGYPFDEVIDSYRADSLSAAARDLALAYRLTGNRRYAEQGANILRGYADRYLTYALHDHYGTKRDVSARVYAQTLDEAIWLIGIAWSYDLLRDSDVFNPSDRKHIEEDLLRPSGTLVSRAMAPTLNWQVWDDAALAAVGYVLNDQGMVSKAIDGPDGAIAMLHKSVLDGFWLEGSWGYQFYTMSAYAYLAQMAVEHGRNLWHEQPLLVDLFRSPLGVSFPNGELPAFNDSVTKTLVDQAPLYEAAYSATGDGVFGAIIGLSARENEEALIFGASTISPSASPRPVSQVFPHIGLARLSAPSSDLTEVVKFGPHGGVHGHFDELNAIIYASGRVMGVDPGTQLYGVPSHATWDKETVAHNTIVVDQVTQAEATGSLLDWKVTPQYSTVMMDAGRAYGNVRLTRRVILTDHYVLEVTSASSLDGKPHLFDWVYHNAGTQQTSLALKPCDCFKKSNGYQHLTHLRSAVLDETWHTNFHVEGNGHTDPADLRVTMLGSAGTRVVVGDGLGPDLRIPIPFVLARRRAVDVEFAVLIQPADATQGVLAVTRMPHGEYKISGSKWTDVITAGATAAFKHLEVGQ